MFIGEGNNTASDSVGFENFYYIFAAFKDRGGYIQCLLGSPVGIISSDIESVYPYKSVTEALGINEGITDFAGYFKRAAVQRRKSAAVRIKHTQQLLSERICFPTEQMLKRNARNTDAL